MSTPMPMIDWAVRPGTDETKALRAFIDRAVDRLDVADRAGAVNVMVQAVVLWLSTIGTRERIASAFAEAVYAIPTESDLSEFRRGAELAVTKLVRAARQQ